MPDIPKLLDQVRQSLRLKGRSYATEKHIFIESISKLQIRFEIKARAGEKAEHIRQYVSISSRAVTQISGLR